MKQFFKFMLMAAIALSAFSCSREIDINTPEEPSKDGKIALKLRAEIAETRTSLDETTGDLFWSYEDEISVFDGTANNEFINDLSQDGDPTKTATFTGEVEASATDFVALYPYNDAAGLSSGKVITVIPSQQVATLGTFAERANVAIGTASIADETIEYDGEYLTGSFAFQNVGSLVKFTITKQDAHKSITIKTKTDTPIAGEVSIDPATAVATATDNAVTEVVIANADGSYLAPGTYYAVLLPVKNVKLSFAFSNGVKTKKLSTSKDVELKRSEVLNFGEIDVNVEYPVLSYSKVSSVEDLIDGDYLIVYEAGSVVFDGSLTTLDVANNNASVVIGDNGITASSDVAQYLFHIAKVENSNPVTYTIKSSSGFYIGATSNSNSLNTSTSTAYTNSISFDDGGNADVVSSGGAYLRYNSDSNAKRFRYYKSSSYTGQKAIAIYGLDTRDALKTPKDLAVNSSTKTVSWSEVTDAANYVVTVGTTTETVSETSYTFAGTDDYYDVSVVAIPATTDTQHKNSAAATLEDAKFGTPTLSTPALEKGEVNETSIEVTWTADTRASAGYGCEIYKGTTKLDKDQTVSAGSVTFDGLEENSEYTIKVKALAVSGDKPYVESEIATIVVSTRETVTIATILRDGVTNSVTLPVATVMAKQGNYSVLSDGTGTIWAYKATGSFSVGDVVRVVGEIKVYSNSYEFNEPTYTKLTSGTPEDYPEVNLITEESTLTAYATGDESSVRVVYATLRGTAKSGKLEIGNTLVTVYNSISTSFNDLAVEATGYLAGWYTNSSNVTSIYFILSEPVKEYVDESITRLSITAPANKTLNWAWDAFGTEQGKDITLDINAQATGYTLTYKDGSDNVVSDPSAEWSIANNTQAKTITVYPKAVASSAANKVLKVIITHNDDATLSETVTLVQAKAPAHGFTVAPNTNPIILNGKANTTYTIKVTSNYAWTATKTSDDFTVEPSAGDPGETTVVIKPVNDGGNAESELGTLTLTDNVDNTVTSQFTIKQAKYEETTTYTYTFTSKDWKATLDGTDANWTSGKDGAGFTNNGIQVTTNATGANGTSPAAFSGVSKVVVTYNTNKSGGSGNLKLQVGNNTEHSADWAYSGSGDGRTANYTCEFNISPSESGSVKLTANTTINSIYIVSVAITATGIQ